MPRKHLVATQTNKKQQFQAKIWQKIAKEIKAAVRVGGPNLDANPRLKAAVDKALLNNLSRDSIERNINGNNKDAANMQQVQFECYGPQGVQLIVGGLTDNNNRTIANLNGYLAKLHGQLAKTNSVKTFFDNLGYILIVKTPNVDVDHVMEWTLNYNVIDIKDLDDVIEIKTAPVDFYRVKEELVKQQCQIHEAEIKLVAQNIITSLLPENAQRLEKFIDSCSEDDDIQWVVTNYEEA